MHACVIMAELDRGGGQTHMDLQRGGSLERLRSWVGRGRLGPGHGAECPMALRYTWARATVHAPWRGQVTLQRALQLGDPTSATNRPKSHSPLAFQHPRRSPHHRITSPIPLDGLSRSHMLSTLPNWPSPAPRSQQPPSTMNRPGMPAGSPSPSLLQPARLPLRHAVL